MSAPKRWSSHKLVFFFFSPSTEASGARLLSLQNRLADRGSVSDGALGAEPVSLPVLKPREVISILVALGFREVRQKGSHKQFRHEDGRTTTVPVHGSRDVSPILLRQVARAAGLTVQEFLGRRR